MWPLYLSFVLYVLSFSLVEQVSATSECIRIDTHTLACTHKDYDEAHLLHIPPRSITLLVLDLYGENEYLPDGRGALGRDEPSTCPVRVLVGRCLPRCKSLIFQVSTCGESDSI